METQSPGKVIKVECFSILFLTFNIYDIKTYEEGVLPPLLLGYASVNSCTVQSTHKKGNIKKIGHLGLQEYLLMQR